MNSCHTFSISIFFFFSLLLFAPPKGRVVAPQLPRLHLALAVALAPPYVEKTVQESEIKMLQMSKL